MADGRQEAMDQLLWNQTDHLLVMIHNVHCTEKGSAKNFGDYNPYVTKKAKKGIPITAENIDLLKVMVKKGARS